ncbi:GNAT family N-acetyltransferase [Actinomadura rugatobispora]|uniref:GNAT family N-acetyltransferase n=1 Tax=Actinomadura rugatobispora TaxID=1994 RepID=A0ABW1AD51_9ACTN|nr:GNAT family N-acetyltransferase [Actinomadura rugatobispora]
MAEPGVTVRPARPGEYARVGELTVEVYVRGGLVRPDSSYVERLRNAADRAAKAELLVAEMAGEIAGAVAYCPPDSPYAELAAADEGEFRMLAVLERSRGGGAGRALVQACADRARDAGLVALRLSTQPNMRAAQRMYERMGFARTPERDWNPVPGVDLMTYVLALRPEGRPGPGPRPG